MISTRALSYLNTGDTVVADLGSQGAIRCFVRIRPTPKPGVPREERRYLNSTWTIWEYWDFDVRKLCLKPGWEIDEWNYDRFIEESLNKMARSESELSALLIAWQANEAEFAHVSESSCPE